MADASSGALPPLRTSEGSAPRSAPLEVRIAQHSALINDRLRTVELIEKPEHDSGRGRGALIPDFVELFRVVLL